MKKQLQVAAVQFEMAQNNKARNLSTMKRFVMEARQRKVDVVLFPELCTTGYHFLTGLGRKALWKIAEDVRHGPTVRFVHQLAKHNRMTILFGMLEGAEDGAMYNTCVVVTPDGPIFRHRKVHAFENSAIHQGDRLELFDLHGWRCGILICYDNNLPENNRVLALRGAEIIFAPHQTGGFDIQRAGMGRIPLKLWRERHENPVPMRQAILGPKGYEWITKWLPSRSYDNGVYTVFANGVGIDGPEVRVGCSMIIDPEGIIVAETTAAEDDMVVATLSKSALQNTLSRSHVAARRPSLYGEICRPIHESDTRTIRNRISGEKIR
jgi:predicted amidohydrolase